MRLDGKLLERMRLEKSRFVRSLGGKRHRDFRVRSCGRGLGDMAFLRGHWWFVGFILGIRTAIRPKCSCVALPVWLCRDGRMLMRERTTSSHSHLHPTLAWARPDQLTPRTCSRPLFSLTDEYSSSNFSLPQSQQHQKQNIHQSPPRLQI